MRRLTDPWLKPHPHEQIFCDNFSVTNIFARVHGATNNTLYAPEMTLNSGDIHDNKVLHNGTPLTC